MSKLLTSIAVIFLLCGTSVARPVPDNFSDLAARLSPAVVNISAEKGRATGDPDQREARSAGSGFIIDPVGLIVTNNHVIEGATDIYVGFADGSRRVARVEGRDAKSDIALLRIWPGKPLPTLTFGDSDEAKAGDWVLAIGNPFGLGGSISAGIISARNRQLDTEIYDDFIQTDAAINRGSSGGPLFDADGLVVGVNASLISPNGGSAGVSFAIPSNTVKTIIAHLRRHGSVRRGWIGANVQDLTPDLARGFGLASAQGALVGHVAPGGPASAAGLLPGDVVISIDTQAVANSRVMQRLIVEAQAGQVLTLALVRKGKTASLPVRVARRMDAADAVVAKVAPPLQGTMLGLSVTEMSREQRARGGLGSAVAGVAVSAVVSGSPAAEAGVQPGDIILEAVQEQVRSPAELRSRIAAARKGNAGVVLLSINRRGELMFKALRFFERKVETALTTARR